MPVLNLLGTQKERKMTKNIGKGRRWNGMDSQQKIKGLGIAREFTVGRLNH